MRLKAVKTTALAVCLAFCALLTVVTGLSSVTLSHSDVLLPSHTPDIALRITASSCVTWKLSQSDSYLKLQADEGECSTGAWIFTTLPRITKSDRYAAEIVVNDVVIPVRFSRIESLSLMTTTKTIFIGENELVRVQGMDSHGNTFSSLDGLVITWQTSASKSLAVVPLSESAVRPEAPIWKGSEYAVLVAKHVSIVTLTGSSGGMSASAEFLVAENVRVSPSVRLLVPGAKVAFSLEGTSSPSMFKWVSENPAVLSLSGSHATAVADGVADVTIVDKRVEREILRIVFEVRSPTALGIGWNHDSCLVEGAKLLGRLLLFVDLHRYVDDLIAAQFVKTAVVVDHAKNSTIHLSVSAFNLHSDYKLVVQPRLSFGADVLYLAGTGTYSISYNMGETTFFAGDIGDYKVVVQDAVQPCNAASAQVRVREAHHYSSLTRVFTQFVGETAVVNVYAFTADGTRFDYVSPQMDYRSILKPTTLDAQFSVIGDHVSFSVKADVISVHDFGIFVVEFVAEPVVPSQLLLPVHVPYRIIIDSAFKVDTQPSSRNGVVECQKVPDEFTVITTVSRNTLTRSYATEVQCRPIHDFRIRSDNFTWVDVPLDLSYSFFDDAFRLFDAPPVSTRLHASFTYNKPGSYLEVLEDFGISRKLHVEVYDPFSVSTSRLIFHPDNKDRSIEANRPFRVLSLPSGVSVLNDSTLHIHGSLSEVHYKITLVDVLWKRPYLLPQVSANVTIDGTFPAQIKLTASAKSPFSVGGDVHFSVVPEIAGTFVGSCSGLKYLGSNTFRAIHQGECRVRYAVPTATDPLLSNEVDLVLVPNLLFDVNVQQELRLLMSGSFQLTANKPFATWMIAESHPACVTVSATHEISGHKFSCWSLIGLRSLVGIEEFRYVNVSVIELDWYGREVYGHGGRRSTAVIDVTPVSEVQHVTVVAQEPVGVAHPQPSLNEGLAQSNASLWMACAVAFVGMLWKFILAAG
jgi:hypothetical protein